MRRSTKLMSLKQKVTSMIKRVLKVIDSMIIKLITVDVANALHTNSGYNGYKRVDGLMTLIYRKLLIITKIAL